MSFEESWNKWADLRIDANLAFQRMSRANDDWLRLKELADSRDEARRDLIRLETEACAAWAELMNSEPRP